MPVHSIHRQVKWSDDQSRIMMIFKAVCERCPLGKDCPKHYPCNNEDGRHPSPQTACLLMVSSGVSFG